MILLEEFNVAVINHFSFLQPEYGFQYKGLESVPFIHYVFYQRKNVLIRIGLSYRHNYIDIYFFYEINLFKPTSQDTKHSISLQDLIFKAKQSTFDHTKDYDIYMPSKIGLDNSLEKLAFLLKSYAIPILVEGKKVILD